MLIGQLIGINRQQYLTAGVTLMLDEGAEVFKNLVLRVRLNNSVGNHHLHLLPVQGVAVGFGRLCAF